MGEAALNLAAQAAADLAVEKLYNPVPTLKRFHEHPGQIRSIVGPVGSGKTSAAAWEVCCYLPFFMLEHYGISLTRGVVVRNTSPELRDTTMRTIFEWFPWGDHQVSRNIYTLRYPDGGPVVEILFRACDRPDQVKSFKSLEILWYWLDEAIEIPEDAKRMLKGRIGRFPARHAYNLAPGQDTPRFGIETTNPPDVEHPTYSQFRWDTPPPGPIPEGRPLKNHFGFWQPPRENEANLRAGYYDDLSRDYADNPDWLEMYVDGKPGMVIRGRVIYVNFRRDRHVAAKPMVWSGGPLYRGWDNTGNCPACIVAQVPTAGRIQVLREFHSDRMGIVDFTRFVIAQGAQFWPGAVYTDFGDPAGAAQFSKADGGLTSNAEMQAELGVEVKPSEQNLSARINAVDQALLRYDCLLIDPSCTRLINGFLGGYCYPVLGTDAHGEKPTKNRFSHPHDALQYLVVKLLTNAPARPRGVFKPRRGVR